MTRKRILGLLAAIGVLGAFLTILTISLIAGAAEIYAYNTADELIVMRNKEVLTRVQIEYTPKYREAVWTLDGRYISFIADDKASPDDGLKRSLVSIDAANGTIRRLSCAYCTSLAPIGGSTMLISVENPDIADWFSAMLRVDLDSDRPPIELPTSLPALKFVFFLSGTADGILVFGIDQNYPGEYYYLLNGDGSAKMIGSRSVYIPNQASRSLRVIQQVVAAQTKDGRSIFAVSATFKDPDNECASRYEVFFVSPSSFINTDISPVSPRDLPPGIDPLVMTPSIWWGLDGRLHAAMVAGPCDGTPKLSDTTGEWMFDGNHWMQISQDKLYAVQELDANTRLMATGEPDYLHGIRLDLETNGHRVKVADNVVSIAVPLSTRRCSCLGSSFISLPPPHDKPHPNTPHK